MEARRGERSLEGEQRAAAIRRVDSVVVRVAFLDALIVSLAPRQVVVLGAGLDTRAWRMEALAGVPCFEVDHPATQAYKRDRAARLGAPLADLRYVPVDFTRDDLGTALVAAGFDPGVATVWVWEGVIMYLDDAALRKTLAAIVRTSAPGSTLLAHYHTPEPRLWVHLLRSAWLRLFGEPQVGCRTPEALQAEVRGVGLDIREDVDLDEQAARVGAAPPEGHVHRETSRILVARMVASPPARISGESATTA